MKVETRLLSFVLTVKLLMTYFKDRKIALQEKKNEKKKNICSTILVQLFSMRW